MKIAFIYPRFTGPYGGERLILNLAHGLHQIGDSVAIYTHKLNPSLLNQTKNIQIIEGYYPTVKNHKVSTLLDFILMPILMLKMKKNYDVIIPVGWQSLFGAYVLKKLNLLQKNSKTLYYCFEPPRFIYDLKKDTLKNLGVTKKLLSNLIINIIKKLDNASINSVDGIIAISDWTANQVTRIYKKNSTIIYPGIETQRFKNISKDSARKKLNIPKNKTVYLSVSKLHHRKRIDSAIDLFINNRKGDGLFYIIGDGPDKNRIEKIIKTSKSNSIVLKGQLSDNYVSLYMKAADYFIFTAKNEPFGIAPLEAKVAGCKIIPHETRYPPVNWKTAAYQNHVVIKQTVYGTKN